jgi:hypothetical protein
MKEKNPHVILETSLMKLDTVATILGAMDGPDPLHLEGPDFTGLFHIINDTCDDIKSAFWPKQQEDLEA